MTGDLFADPIGRARSLGLGAQAAVLRGLAMADADALLVEIERVATLSPFRHMATPGGHIMSAAMTNCGQLGWTSDRYGYRYTEFDPQTGRAWPAMPNVLLELAHRAAQVAGFADFVI